MYTKWHCIIFLHCQCLNKDVRVHKECDNDAFRRVTRLLCLQIMMFYKMNRCTIYLQKPVVELMWTQPAVECEIEMNEWMNELVIMPTHCIYYGFWLFQCALLWYNGQPAAARLPNIILFYALLVTWEGKLNSPLSATVLLVYFILSSRKLSPFCTCRRHKIRDACFIIACNKLSRRVGRKVIVSCPII